MESAVFRLVCVGINHRSADVALREQLQYSVAQQNAILRDRPAGIEELVILSTCNRTELYALGDCDTGETLYQLLTRNGQFSDVHPYILLEQEATLHIMRVAAGLDSQVLGEPQILGQVTTAFQRAQDAGAVGATLSALMMRAIRVGKRARHTTGLSQGALSISAVAARAAQDKIDDLSSATALVVGAGEMGRAAALSLMRRGIGQLMIAGRTFQRAVDLAAHVNGTAIAYETVPTTLHAAHILIVATGSPVPLFHSQNFADRDPAQRLLIFDLGLPRNVDPSVGQLGNIALFNLDDLQETAEAHLAHRRSAIPLAEALIAEASADFDLWRRTRDAVPAICDLLDSAFAEWELNFIHDLQYNPPADTQDIEKRRVLSRRAIKQKLHAPIMALREAAARGQLVPTLPETWIQPC
jgi:glutamyl-tRNA reductase